MTVYVDQFPAEGWGRWNGGGHLLGNDLAELHAFAARLGCQRSWFQGKNHAHYDLTKSKRDLAVRLGAVELAWAEIPRDCLMRDDKGGYTPRNVLRRQRGLTKRKFAAQR